MKRDSFWFSKELYVRIEKESGGDEKKYKNMILAVLKYALDGEETLYLTSWMKDELERIEKIKERQTAEYRRWKAAVLERDNFTCVLCGQVGGELNVHHIKPYSKYPELRTDINNGVTLCKECHKEVHRKKK